MFVFNTIVVANHRRSGRLWAIDALRHNSPDISDAFLSLDQIDPGHDAAISLADFRRKLLNLEGRVLVNVQDLPEGNAWSGLDERLFARTILNNSPTIFVHRDGRDVLVSLYYYMRTFSETVRNQSFTQFLRADAAAEDEAGSLSRPGYWAHHSRAWLQKPNSLAVPYRDLETDYEAAVGRMAAFLGVSLAENLQPLSLPGPPAKDSRLRAVMHRLGIGRRGRVAGPRVGRSGDWRGHFDKRDHAFFMREAGDMMRRLGYVN